MRMMIMKVAILVLLVSLSGCGGVSGVGAGSNTGSTFILGKMVSF